MKSLNYKTVAPNHLCFPTVRTCFVFLLLLLGAQFAGAQNWLLGGNALTNPATQFLGSTNAMDLRFRTNNQVRMVIGGTTGNVGIGESAPAFPLHFAAATGNKICLYQSGANQYGLGIAANQMQLYVPTSSASFVFGTGHSTSFTERMRITGGGNVGIGVSAPTFRLQVLSTNTPRAGYFRNTYNSSSETYGIFAESDNPGSGNATGGYFTASGANGTLNQALYASASGNTTNYGAYTRALSSNGQSAVGLYATASGTGSNLSAIFDGPVWANNKFAIAPTSPSVLNANSNLASFYVENRSNLRAGTFSTFRTTQDQVYGLHTVCQNNGTGNTIGGYFWALGGDTTCRALQAEAWGRGTVYGTYSRAVVGTANDIAIGLYATAVGSGSKIAAHLDGRVGIGTAAIPDGYLLAVDGRMICEEVRVQLSGQWPDYVFHKNYPLMPLEELEKSIAANNHLPGIPSAAEVELQGISVGDMQTKMMAKIEELTLYMIALKKENEALKHEVSELKKRL